MSESEDSIFIVFDLGPPRPVVAVTVGSKDAVEKAKNQAESANYEIVEFMTSDGIEPSRIYFLCPGCGKEVNLHV